MLWMDLYLLFSCSVFRFILKIVSAENCCGKRSAKCCSRISEASCHKVRLLIARAACASVSRGFSSYSQSMMMRSDGKTAQQSQKLLHLSAALDNLSFKLRKTGGSHGRLRG